MSSQYEPRDAAYEQKVRDSFQRQDVMQTIGASVVSVMPGEVQLKFPYSRTLTQQHDFIHAGILSTVLDSACGYAAFSLMEPGAGVLTIEFKISLQAPAAGDEFIARGEVTRSGRTIIFTRGEMQAVSDSGVQTVATMTATMMTVRGREGIKG